MDEKTLLKIALVATLVGLCFLFFYSEELELNVVENIEETSQEEIVKVRGVVKKLNVQEKVIFLEILTDNDETITAILFSSEDVYLNEGNYVEVVGEVEEYQGKKEILTNYVKLI